MKPKFTKQAENGCVTRPPWNAVALDASSGRLLLREGASVSARPGSAWKPFVAASLRGRVPEIACRREVRIGGRRFDCTHPHVSGPIGAVEALAYSCNYWFTSIPRFVDLAALRTWGLRADSPRTLEQAALLAIGEWGVACRADELAGAYRRLLGRAPAAVREGLVAAAKYGTARLAAPSSRVAVAGKTGTTSTASWWAGWAPVSRPRVVLAVQLPSGRGGIDAAPVARDVFERLGL